MVTNKQQHYVAQLYLRGFSSDGERVWIFNLKQGKSVLGRISKTCSESYFYSKNIEIEQSLNLLEDAVARIIREIISSEKLPDNFEEKSHLFAFILLQHSKIAKAKDASKRLTKLMSDTITESKGLSGYTIVNESDHLYKMLVGLTSLPLVSDLKAVLLINTTEKPFITSDHPVVFHNTKFNRLKNYGTTGMQSKGLQIFWPITKSLSILLYDPICYNVSKEDGTVILNSEEDVLAINALQYLYCREIVIFNDISEENYIQEIGKRVSHIRKETLAKRTLPHPTKSNAEIIQFYNERLNYDLELSFIEVKDGIKPGYRNRSIIEEHEKFHKKLMQKEPDDTPTDTNRETPKREYKCYYSDIPLMSD